MELDDSRLNPRNIKQPTSWKTEIDVDRIAARFGYPSAGGFLFPRGYLASQTYNLVIIDRLGDSNE